MEFFLALMRAGAVAVPLDSAEPVAAQRQIAEALRAGFWWSGEELVALEGARRFRDPATCLIKLTSGTTGRPRPLVFTAEQMLADGRQVTTTMGIRATDLNYALIPFGHSYGLGNLTFPLFAQGVPVVCGTAPLPQAIAEDFGRWQPTVLPSVPAVFRALVEADIAPATCASLRLAISAGAPLPPETAAAFAKKFGRKIHAFYGSSETGGIAYDRRGQATLAGGVGSAMRGVRITALRGGRLRICSAAVFTQGNARRSGRHGCWSPADHATLDARGQITLLGRRGTTVKIAGRRVNLAEVAARLRRLPGVRDAWVGMRAGAEPVMGAAIVSARSSAEIRAELLTDTATWKVPKKWAALPAFPLTERGKTDTRALHAAVFGSSL
jgi:acyl-coenzyme A synthetase/AMP-(fatty) acid ligase